MNIKNSKGQIIGETTINDNSLIINTYNKPILIIDDIDIINKVKNKDESGFEVLFNDYTLTIGEIASLYGMVYATTRKHLIKQGFDTNSHAGRRNSSYGQTFSEERRKHIGEKSRGRYIVPYERTPEIREKISSSLKQYYHDHPVSDETKQKLSDAWTRGCYDNSPMGRGYNGYFYSLKNQTDLHFRSFLELFYYLLLENDDTVITYQEEPFVIKLPNNHKYIPDVLINDKDVIELKPQKHLNWENQERWEMELKGATQYCKNHNFNFKVIYDTDIGFDTAKFKRWYKFHQDELTQYNIRLNKPIVWS